MTSTSAQKTVNAQQIESYCNQLLFANEFKDYCPNGLQVDANAPISKVVTGVTASLALIEAAKETQANALLVHHGYFWKGEPDTLTGIKGARVRALMQAGISLLAYHLPLDAHPTIGNNAALANLLGFELGEALYPHEARPVGNIITAREQVSARVLAQRIAEALNREPLHIAPPLADMQAPLARIGLCTGAAQDFIEQAALMGCDAFISGEISERTTHSARELGIHYFACGHHATEMLGIQNLGQAVGSEFGVAVEFINIDNPA